MCNYCTIKLPRVLKCVTVVRFASAWQAGRRKPPGGDRTRSKKSIKRAISVSKFVIELSRSFPGAQGSMQLNSKG